MALYGPQPGDSMNCGLLALQVVLFGDKWTCTDLYVFASLAPDLICFLKAYLGLENGLLPR